MNESLYISSVTDLALDEAIAEYQELVILSRNPAFAQGNDRLHNRVAFLRRMISEAVCKPKGTDNDKANAVN